MKGHADAASCRQSAAARQLRPWSGSKTRPSPSVIFFPRRVRG